MLKHIVISFVIIVTSIDYCAAEKIAGVQYKAPPDEAFHKNMVWIPGGTFMMGSSTYYPEEQPVNKVSVTGFWMDKYEVTNQQFSAFVNATGYITVAEHPLNPDTFPEIPATHLKAGSVVFTHSAPHWQFIVGANWRHPTGPGSNLQGKAQHPVVHIAYEDALAYAKWLGHTLPTEAQWEYAARGGLVQKNYTWGDKLTPNVVWQANIWQGLFPVQNTGHDGYTDTAPVGCYPANGFGLYDMTGNVWEWVSDWYYPSHQKNKPVSISQKNTGYDPRQPGVPVKVIKGGSYLCAENYCKRYRPAARHAQDITLGTSHIGFRTVKNISNTIKPKN